MRVCEVYTVRTACNAGLRYASPAYKFIKKGLTGGRAGASLSLVRAARLDGGRVGRLLASVASVFDK
jgi:hypothetical protein